jgi:hypothetical protein
VLEEEGQEMRKDYIDHVIKLAEMDCSKLSEEAKSIGGFASHKVKHLLNNLCSYGEINYLEIGVLFGATLIAASYGNIGRFVGIDNFSEFNEENKHDEHTVMANVEKFEYFTKNASLWIGDAFNQDIIEKSYIENSVDIFLYDGQHSYENQKKALISYIDKMKDRFVYIVDDWNWEDSQNGALDSIKELGLKIIHKRELFTPERKNGCADSWWNGIGIFLLDKGETTCKKH